MRQSEQVLKYLDEHIRMHIHVADVAKDLGITEEQVSKAIWYLGSKKGLPIAKVTQGVWYYDPSKKEEPKPNGQKLFECIGESKQDKLVLQDEDGELYVAERL